MGTRSTIAMEFADGTVEQVYCHWDGYLENNGKILYNHYVDPFKTRDLIDLGGFSSLETTVEGTAATAYTQRGEDLQVSKFVDFQDYLAHHQYEEYEYILRRDGNWYVKCHDAAYVMLVDAIADHLIREAMQEEETL
jgi:hypothetical protein